MITHCWTVVRHIAPRLHHHAAHLVHRSGRILHRLPKFAHHPFHPTMLVCRALPLGLASAGLLNIAATEPPGHLVTPSALVQPLGRFVEPYQTSGLPPLPSPFACCSGQFAPPNDPGMKPSLTTLVGDPGPVEPGPVDPGPVGDPPVTVPPIADPGPPPTNSVDEPSSVVVVLAGLASLLLFRRDCRVRA
jgi:hypothetical protein